jgi:hypothetical protein
MGYFGAPTSHEGHKTQQILDDGYGFLIASEDEQTHELLHNDLNWHTIDIDALCEQAVVTDSNEMCSTCTCLRILR